MTNYVTFSGNATWSNGSNPTAGLVTSDPHTSTSIPPVDAVMSQLRTELQNIITLIDPTLTGSTNVWNGTSSYANFAGNSVSATKRALAQSLLVLVKSLGPDMQALGSKIVSISQLCSQLDAKTS
jgi:hypothetical protein